MHNQTSNCCLPKILPSCPNFHLYSYLAISPLRPKQCLHKLSQSSWENNRTYCIHQLYTSHATFTYLAQNFHLCTSSLRTASVTVHIWKRKECLQSGLHSVAFFSHPQRSLQHRKRGCAAGSGAEGVEKAVLQFGEGGGGEERRFEVSLQDGSRPISPHREAELEQTELCCLCMSPTC